MPVFQEPQVKKASITRSHAVGVLLLATFSVLIAILLFDSGDADPDRLVRKSLSPNGMFMAELRRNVAPQFGGPDFLYVLIRKVGAPSGEVVYSKTTECSDLTAFGVSWNSATKLVVSYGECQSKRWNIHPESQVWKIGSKWGPISIDYEDTGYVAQH